jgi:hypothetical protein
MQNDSSKLILSSLVNEFLNASYIQLTIFLFISFKYDYFFNFFISIVFFLNILFFNFWGKKRCGREMTKFFLQPTYMIYVHFFNNIEGNSFKFYLTIKVIYVRLFFKKEKLCQKRNM